MPVANCGGMACGARSRASAGAVFSFRVRASGRHRRDIEQQLRRAGKGYVLGVSSAHVFQSWGARRSVAGKAADIARTRRASEWKRLSAGAGTKGPRLHDWCYLELADLEVEEFYSANHGLWTRGLLIRRNIADGDLAFFTTWC